MPGGRTLHAEGTAIAKILQNEQATMAGTELVREQWIYRDINAAEARSDRTVGSFGFYKQNGELLEGFELT